MCLVLLISQAFWACNGGSERKHDGKKQADTLAIADSLTSEFVVGRDFKLRVYLDNSASMQGYLNASDGSEFLRFVDDYVLPLRSNTWRRARRVIFIARG